MSPPRGGSSIPFKERVRQKRQRNLMQKATRGNPKYRTKAHDRYTPPRDKINPRNIEEHYYD